MKRLLLFAIAVMALAIPAMATADSNHSSLWLSGPETAMTGEDFTLDVTTHDSHAKTADIAVYMGTGCSSYHFVQMQHHVSIHDGWTLSIDALTQTDYSFKAFLGHESSNCENVTIEVPKPAPLTAAGAPSSLFLCYSAYQDQPGAWVMPEAKKLFAAGYWQPFAVSGKVTGGTNVGNYHLTCNLAAGQSVADVHGYVGGGGTVYGPDLHDAMSSVLGNYPVVG